MTDETTAAGDEIAAAAISDGAYTLIVADFADVDVAMEAYQTLKEVEDGATVKIEGVLVVQRDGAGKLEVQKVTDHSTREGVRWGAVGGAVVGILFPPSILGSVLLVGAGGGLIGKLRERHHKKELAEELQDAIEPATPASSRSCPTQAR